jgi:hypothetical protein
MRLSRGLPGWTAPKKSLENLAKKRTPGRFMPSAGVSLLLFLKRILSSKLIEKQDKKP